jgi:hypothetical protein
MTEDRNNLAAGALAEDNTDQVIALQEREDAIRERIGVLQGDPRARLLRCRGIA